MLPTDTEAEELEHDWKVIAAATPGPWSVERVDDSLCMNAVLVVNDTDAASLENHNNNIAIVLLQSPRYSDIKDGRWDENAESNGLICLNAGWRSCSNRTR